MTNDDKIVIVKPETSSHKCYLPARFALTFMIACAMALEYAQKVCISVTIVVMVNHTALDPPNTTTEEDKTCPLPQTFNETDPKTQGDYVWNPSIQGAVLGAYYYGFICSQIVGGRLSEIAGGKWPLGISIFVGSILTLITPTAADIGVGAIIVVRAMMGLLHGICLPTAFALFAHWAPEEERSTMISLCLIGDHIGIVLAMPLAGYLCDHGFAGGWPSVFYILGLLGCIWFVFWACLAHSKPSDHPRISKEEMDYIQKGQIQIIDDQKLPVPWSKVLRSMPVWSLTLAMFSTSWGTTTLITKLPTYMEVVLHVPIQKNGLLNSFIYVCTCITLFFSGYLSDYLRSKKGFSPTKVRKGFQSAAMLGPAILTALVPSVGCNKVFAIALLTLSMTFVGMCGGGFMSIAADMAPHYAATIFGLTNGIGSTAGILSPVIAGLILDKAHASLAQWSFVFYLSTMLYLIGGLVFLIWASGEIQSWAYTTEKEQILNVPGTQKDPTLFTSEDDMEKRAKI